MTGRVSGVKVPNAVNCAVANLILRQSPSSTELGRFLSAILDIFKTLKTITNDGLPTHRQRALHGRRYGAEPTQRLRHLLIRSSWL